MNSVGRLVRWLKPYLHWLIAGALLMGGGGALMAAVVATFKPLINRVFVVDEASSTPVQLPGDPVPVPGGGDPDILSKLQAWLPTDRMASWIAEEPFVQVPILMIVIFLIRGIFLYFGNYFTIKAGASAIRDMRLELYESVTHQSLGFFQAHSTGMILSRILNDVDRLKDVFTSVLADLFRIGAAIPFLLVMAIWHDWRMSIVTFIAFPLLAYPALRLGKRLRRASAVSQENMGALAAQLTESVVGARVVQGFGMERFEIDRFRKTLDNMFRADMRAGRTRALAPPLMELMGSIVGAGLFLVAGFAIARGKLDPGDFTVIMVSLGLLFTSMRRLANQYAALQVGAAAEARVDAILKHEREIRDRDDAVTLDGFSDSIEFDNVTFSYGDEQVLDGINLTIKRGEVVALVGASGSGKSTLVNLLPRFWDPTGGSVKIDGHDLRDLSLVSLRKQIGIVTQETILFDDTVRNNIAYGRADLPEEAVLEAAVDAYADEFIQKLPEGYETQLGERGTRLSMGQRQRITIARALLKSPPLLILDEATSALDTESEALVQRALERLMEGRTAIVIAHRLSTVRRADRILVMGAGHIVEEGSHDQLLAADGAYARLYEMQFRDDES